jgi:hypothetical protein
VLFGGYAGLRLGELAALKASSFTTGLRAVRVVERLTDVHGIIAIGPPKTAASIRTIALPGFLAAEIQQHLATFAGSADGLLFTAPLGGTPPLLGFPSKSLGTGSKKGGLGVVHAIQSAPRPSRAAHRGGRAAFDDRQTTGTYQCPGDSGHLRPLVRRYGRGRRREAGRNFAHQAKW